MINPQAFELSDYLGKRFTCSCGQDHSIDLKMIDIAQGAIGRLPDTLKNGGYRRPLIVCDNHTYDVAGKQVEQALAGFAPDVYVLNRETDLIPDEVACGELLVHIADDIDVIVAVGTGTLNDLCKYISYRIGQDYIIVATAPSMDGFASVGAPLIVDGLKTTYDAHSPVAIIAEPAILCDAPMDLITAGLGDTLGKYGCLLDWKIGHIINDEYYCQTIVDMVEESVAKVTKYADQIQSRSPEAIIAVMEALILTGIAMGFVGNSRPASGSEHHLSHYWEMLFLFDGKVPILHGTKVGIGTVASIYLYHELERRQIDFDLARKQALQFDYAAWEALIRRTYRSGAPGVIALEAKVKKNDPHMVLKRIDRIEERWPLILKAIGKLPATQDIEDQLRSVGAPINPQQVGVGKQEAKDSVLVCKEIRDRYTILQLLHDLGLLGSMADRATSHFGY